MPARPAFYTGGGVPDTLDGRFELIALHAFVVLRRLQAEPERTGELAQSLFDEMFDDMDRCLREMGAGDLGVGRRVKFMASSFLGRIKAYGQGLDGDDAALEEALLRNLYGTVPAPPDGAAAMARYARDQAAALEAQPLDALMQGRLRFGRRLRSSGPAGMTPEFSRIVRLERIPESGMVREIEAGEGERAALARRFAILSIDSFAARVELGRSRNGDVRLTARMTARVVQECVVTLEPVESEIDEAVRLRFRPVAEDAADRKTVVIPADEDFEPLTGDALDIGEAIAVELALALDPFPRSPEAGDTPFAALEERSENG